MARAPSTSARTSASIRGASRRSGRGCRAGATSFDGEGRTAIPGLIDAHTYLSFNTTPHFREDAVGQPHPYQALLTAKRAEALLAQGVTTARDVGGVAPVILVLDADPLVDLKATRAIRHILQDGDFVVQPG